MKTILVFTILLSATPLVVADVNDGRFSAQVTPSAAPSPELPITDYDGTIKSFREEYVKANKPKIIVYVNRSLVKNRGEMLDVVTVQNSTQTKGDPVPLPNTGNIQIGTENQAAKEAKPTVSGKGGERLETSTGSLRTNSERDLGVTALTEVEARSIEEAFQKPLFDAGTKIVDQKIAQMASRTFAEAGDQFLTSPKTDKEREEILALRKSGDVVIEVLARNRFSIIPMPSGDDIREERLDLVVTAISLKDGIKLAQVSSDSLFGFNQSQGNRAQSRYSQISSAQIIEQTALALMQRLSF